MIKRTRIRKAVGWPERATENEKRWLADHGFNFAEDAGGDLYYVGPLGHIVHLYPGNKWDSDRGGGCQSLEEYVALLSAKVALLR